MVPDTGKDTQVLNWSASPYAVYGRGATALVALGMPYCPIPLSNVATAVPVAGALRGTRPATVCPMMKRPSLLPSMCAVVVWQGRAAQGPGVIMRPQSSKASSSTAGSKEAWGGGGIGVPGLES